MRIVHDERGIILSWIIKLLLSLALFGLALFEAGAVIVSRVTVDRIAIDAAQEAGLEYRRTNGSTSKARAVAENFAQTNDAELIDFQVLNDGETISVTVRKEASVLIIDRIPPLEDFTIAEATNSAPVN